MQPNCKPALLSLVRRFYAQLSRRRRVQLIGLVFLLLVGAMAEIVTLGAVLPFLALMADAKKAMEYPILQDIVGALGWESPDQLLLPVTIIFGSLAILSSALRMLLIWASNKVTYGIGHDLSVDVYRRTLFQPYQYHVEHNSSEILAGMSKAQSIVGNLLTPLISTFIAMITAIAILVALILIDINVALTAGLIFGIFYSIITLSTRRSLSRNSALISRAQGVRIQAVQEGLGGIRDVLIDDSQRLYLDRYRRVDAALCRGLVSNNLIAMSPRYLIEAIGMILIAALAYALSQRAGGLIAALPVLGALAIGAQKLLPLMQQIYTGWATIAGNWGMIHDVMGLIQMAIPDEYSTDSSIDGVEFDRDIVFSNVSFQYLGMGRKVICDVSLRIGKGDRVGFVGKTGSGKSTALDLIMGLLEPTSGRLLIDGSSLNATNRRGWQRRIAHVPQTIYLSDASINENIAFGIERENIDYKRVREVARQAQIAEHIESLELQYDTLVGERGIRLSGGQRQRIGIARALYKQADVLIFDEATSALDDNTEQLVINSISSLGPEITIIMIAHRVSTLRSCDCIFEFRDGKLLRQGTYPQIVKFTNV